MHIIYITLTNVPVALRLTLVQCECEDRVVCPRVFESAVQSLRLDLELLLRAVQLLQVRLLQKIRHEMLGDHRGAHLKYVGV